MQTHAHQVLLAVAAVMLAASSAPAFARPERIDPAAPQVVTWDCNTAGAVSLFGGWNGGDSQCDQNGGFILYAGADAYFGWVRTTPILGDVIVETTVMRGDRDGAATDGFSLLLRWSGSSDPTACCEPVHAASGVRLFFSLDRDRVELTVESDGASGPVVATLPFSLPDQATRAIRVDLHGATLDLTVDGSPAGTLAVPAGLVGSVGFDARGIAVGFAPLRLTFGCPGDRDCDGVPDASDNCPTVDQPDQTDTDHDGLGNPCDPDDDGDGLPDGSDRCPLVADPSNADADGDGVGDVCDACPQDAANDLDQDGVCGNVDNCPLDFNPGQENLDADAEGDLCDLDDGLIVVRWTDRTHLSYQRESPFDTYNLYRRSVSDLRATGIYVPNPQTAPGWRTCNLTENPVLTTVNPPSGEAWLYFVSGSTAGVDGGLGENSSGIARPDDYPCACPNDFPCGCLPMTRVAHATDGGQWPDRVIDNFAAWCAYMPSLCDPGVIDFNTEVAVVHVGDGSDTCADTKITCVEKTTTGYRVSSNDIEYSCICFDILTSPYDIVKVPRPVTSPTFASTFTRLACP